MQTPHLFTPLSPPWAALVDCVQIHAVYLPICCVVCCPEEEKCCESRTIGIAGSYIIGLHIMNITKCDIIVSYISRITSLGF